MRRSIRISCRFREHRFVHYPGSLSKQPERTPVRPTKIRRYSQAVISPTQWRHFSSYHQKRNNRFRKFTLSETGSLKPYCVSSRRGALQAPNQSIKPNRIRARHASPLRYFKSFVVVCVGATHESPNHLFTRSNPIILPVSWQHPFSGVTGEATAFGLGGWDIRVEAGGHGFVIEAQHTVIG